MSRVLVIGGPTASGKTGVALSIAQEFDAVVVSADAMQVYRGMDIGTGKATVEERAMVPHFGLDLVEPDQSFDAAGFVALADRAIDDHERVVVAGGTSLYLEALIRGLVRTPRVDPDLRAELEQIEDLHGALAAVDPALASRLHANDRVRLIRGLEVFRQTGQQLSQLQATHALQPDRVAVERLWLDRDDLDERIDARVHSMIERGYVVEVSGLLERGYDRTLRSMQSLGYRHLCDHVIDGLELDETIRRTQRDTRRFARKQRTWRKRFAVSQTLDQHLETARSAATRAFVR